MPPRPPGQKTWLTAVVAALVAVAVLLLVLFLPRYLLSWDLAGNTARTADRAAEVNAIRSTRMQGLAGLAVLAGAVFTWRQLQVSRQGQVTDRYTRAIEQLGEDSPVLRVGGIYALERIARDSVPSLPVVSPGVDLRGADLTGVWLVDAIIDGARLHQADLRRAVLWKARLIGADLRATDLTAADLTGARLHGARFDLADLRGTDFTTADLNGATLTGAVADDTTTWPGGFDPQQAGVLPAGKAPPLRPQSYSADP